jgi:serine/threonine protein kinase
LIQQSSTKLKPGDWWVKLADFGISKQLEAIATGNHTVCGTPGYLPPEIVKQAWGETNILAVDYPAADMWALGIMTFRMMTGAAPFPSVSDVLKYADGSKLFPSFPLDKKDIGSDGISWVRELLHPSTTARLASDRAISHDWIRRSVPDLRVILAASHR